MKFDTKYIKSIWQRFGLPISYVVVIICGTWVSANIFLIDVGVTDIATPHDTIMDYSVALGVTLLVIGAAGAISPTVHVARAFFSGQDLNMHRFLIRDILMVSLSMALGVVIVLGYIYVNADFFAELMEATYNCVYNSIPKCDADQ